MKSDLQDPRIIDGLNYFSKHTRQRIIDLISSYPESFFKPKNTYIDSNGYERVNMTWDMDVLEQMNEIGDIWYVPWENVFCISGTEGEVCPWTKIDNASKVGHIANILDCIKRKRPGLPRSWYIKEGYFFPKGTLSKWHYPTSEPMYSPHILSKIKKLKTP